MLAMQSMIALIAMIANVRFDCVKLRLKEGFLKEGLKGFCAPAHVFLSSERNDWERSDCLARVFPGGNPLINMASKYAAELQRPYPGLTERRGVGGGPPRSLFLKIANGSAS